MPALSDVKENSASDDHSCPACGESVEGEHRLPHVRIPSRGGVGRSWHFRCISDMFSFHKHDNMPTAKRRCIRDPGDFSLNGYLDVLEQLVSLSPDLMKHFQPRISMCGEELSLLRAAEGAWPTSCIADLHPIAYQFHGLCELRIASCSSLRTIPPEVGQMRGLQSLVCISDGLTSLPDEIGQLHNLEYLFLNGNFITSMPKPICELPRLKEMCLDANLIKIVPPITSPHLEMFTAPANLLEEMPDMCPGVKRIEAHGNQLTSVKLSTQPWLGSSNKWERVMTLKLMGNQLRELPTEVGQMHALKTLLVANNNLRALPEGIVDLQELQWLYAYDNDITSLPQGLLMRCKRLDRILLEGNPLTNAAIEALAKDAPSSKVGTIGLDLAQVNQYISSTSSTCLPLPHSFKIGSLVPIDGSDEHYYMKKVLWSQLVKTSAKPQLGGLEDLADNLVVAFSASQAEPEWLGVLARAAQPCEMEALRPPESSLEEFFLSRGLERAENESYSLTRREACIASLWSIDSPTIDSSKSCARNTSDDQDKLAPFKFDVLCLVDHCMSWYAADPDRLTKALLGVTKSYKRVICIGASMGGFGAILHGGRLADSVVAFSPQCKLVDSGLRPRAQSLHALQALTDDLKDSIRIARERGASIKIHCATDDHLWHALQLPLEDHALTVHPLQPMKPFARLLDRCKILMPIIIDAFVELLKSPVSLEHRGAAATFSNLALCGGLLGNRAPSEDLEKPSATAVPASTDGFPHKQIGVAGWYRSGGFTRFTTNAKQLIELFYSPPASYPPRPGQWFCAECRWRNPICRFFCKSYNCQISRKPSVMQGVRVPDGSLYPQTGDWGCGNCGEALFKSHANCIRCGTSHSDERNFVVP